MSLGRLPEGSGKRCDSFVCNIRDLPRRHGVLAVAEGAEASEVFQGGHEALYRPDGLRVVVQRAAATGTDAQEQPLGEVRERVVIPHSPEDPQDLVGLPISRGPPCQTHTAVCAA